MSLSSIQTNIAALLKKAYNTDTSAVAASNEASKEVKETADDNSSTASASAEVTLGETGNTTEIYTAQGLLQQMRQIQLSNTKLLYGGEESSDDNSSLLGMMASGNSAELEAMSEDWANTISEHPEKAALMVESAKNASINTMLGGQG